ncbi:hypothetical protein ODZ83_00640 [Acaricomes phytoseiuli]|uniref:hypothetical protein n=1 Tax=Acaricomes phytoseiuli TaxID=291968 RepID=UPI00039F3094|nr:hypothetical protein [Acaricomes phytoseiuli]MCW1248720.1 hypothetical protein [Acaricomes phytoseiuli]
MDKTHGGSATHAAALEVSGATVEPWGRILRLCLITTLPVALLLTLLAAVLASPWAALSALLATVVAIAGLGSSLYAAHIVWKNQPDNLLLMFMAGYAIKFFVLAIGLLILGVPEWLDRFWFFATALITVLVWLGAEVLGFSRVRWQLYTDPEATSGERTEQSSGHHSEHPARGAL